MRKALNYIALLTLLLTFSWQLQAVPALVVPFASQPSVNAHLNRHTASTLDTGFQKGDVLNDLDDYDEYDFDSHNGSVKEKPSDGLLSFVNTTPSARLITRPGCTEAYTCRNLSRLPRHTFVSLRVLRI